MWASLISSKTANCFTKRWQICSLWMGAVASSLHITSHSPETPSTLETMEWTRDQTATLLIQKKPCLPTHCEERNRLKVSDSRTAKVLVFDTFQHLGDCLNLWWAGVHTASSQGQKWPLINTPALEWQTLASRKCLFLSAQLYCTYESQGTNCDNYIHNYY